MQTGGSLDQTGQTSLDTRPLSKIEETLMDRSINKSKLSGSRGSSKVARAGVQAIKRGMSTSPDLEASATSPRTMN